MAMTFKGIISNKPFFSLMSATCLVGCLPTAVAAVHLLGPKEDLLGYGVLGVALTTILLVLFTGWVFSVGALFRREKPLYFAMATFTANTFAILWVIISKPV
jgi:hypothetical protein